ncbi:MAG: transposase domain-containing protein [Pseudomonadota bacterium]
MWRIEQDTRGQIVFTPPPLHSSLFDDDGSEHRHLSTVADANATANLSSLIETPKASSIERYCYLRHVFTELPKAVSTEATDALLPHRMD